MQNVKIHPASSVQITENVAIELMFNGLRKCNQYRSNICIVTDCRSGDQMMVKVELSLTQGEFIVTLMDHLGRFVATARCDQYDL